MDEMEEQRLRQWVRNWQEVAPISAPLLAPVLTLFSSLRSFHRLYRIQQKESWTTLLSCQLFNDIGRFASYREGSRSDLLNRRELLEQMFGKNNEILDVNNTVTPGHGADVT